MLPMPPRQSKLRVILYGVGVLVGLLVLAQIALLLFFDANAYKDRIERVASRALGMQVKLRGRLSVELLPGLHIAARDIRINSRGTELVAIKHARVGIELLPLLWGELRLGAIHLTRPRIYIERDSGGRYNFERATGKPSGALPAFAIGHISLDDLALVYADRQRGDTIAASGCRLDLHHVQAPAGPTNKLAAKLTLAAWLACRSVERGNFTVSDLKLTTTAANGVFVLKPITLRLLGGDGAGSVRVDISQPVMRVALGFTLREFRAEELFHAAASKQVARGALDLSAELSLRGRTGREMVRSAEGTISLHGADLRLLDTDIDTALARYESSQTFGLLDVGALFFAGPIGLVATKGYSFAALARDARGDTHIGKLVSDWNVTASVAHAHDVALATRANRLAVQGRLDFVNERFDEVTIAVIDANGCAKLRQTIRGPFQNPALDKPSVLASIAGPAVRLFKKIAGGQCQAFYAGSVAPP